MQSGSTTTDSPAEEDDAMRYIEYIESTGTQYINTGVAIESGSISYEISAAYTVVNANEQDIIGNLTQLPWSSGLTLCGLFDGHIGCHQYGTEHMNLQSDTTPVAEQIYTISGSASAAGQTLTVNGTSYTRSGVAVNSEPFYLFCNGSEQGRWAHVRLYSCKIWDGSTLVRDFVPAVDNGTPGLYDRVTDAFYTNSGTGNFLYPKWIMTADGLVNPDMPPIAETCIATPYPAQYWRIKPGTHNGRLYHDLLPNVTSVIPSPVEERPVSSYICVYDMETKQDNFEDHGLAVLSPTTCMVTEQLNGEFSVTLEHPKDVEGKWEFLREWNIIKVFGQLFIIQKICDNWRNRSGSVTVWAEHITYQLQESWLFPGTPVGAIVPVTGEGLLHNIVTLINEGFDMSHMTYYIWTVRSDIDVPPEFHDWDSLEDGATPYAMLLGGNGFVAKFGGELYRDNFYFSINKRMENSDDNAFELRVGKNLTGVQKTIDLSTAAFYFRGYDNYGSSFSVSWAEATLPRAFPRTIVRSQQFSYSEPDFDRLARDTMSHFGRYCAPLISYDVTVKDATNNPDFKMFVNRDRLKVGDKGKVWDVDLGGYTVLEITKTVTNAITGEVEEVTFGSTRSFTRPMSYSPIVSNTFVPVISGGEMALQDSEGFFLNDSEDYQLCSVIRKEDEE
jgi:hypothetical protein